jgi:CubicO group peptidase (beta-lactamase class C family)
LTWVHNSERPSENCPQDDKSGKLGDRSARQPEQEGYPGRGYYQYMWWGMEREDGSYDCAAEGDKGQFIYISPPKNLVIVRNGVAFGIPAHDWLKLFYEFARDFNGP